MRDYYSKVNAKTITEEGRIESKIRVTKEKKKEKGNQPKCNVIKNDG